MKSHMKDIHSRSDSELRTLISSKDEALRVFRFALAGSRTRNVREGRALRKERARMATELGERSRSASLGK